MNVARFARVPYLSLRYALIGRVGESGQLPHGWNGEHLSDIEVVDVNSPGEPWLTLDLGFRENMPGNYAGLCVGAYLEASKGSVVTLTGEVALAEHSNIEAAYMIIREWEPGGRLITQSTQPLAVSEGAQVAFVSHTVAGHERVMQPMFMIKRQSVAPGRLSLTLRGLAVGDAEDHPEWLQSVLDG